MFFSVCLSDLSAALFCSFQIIGIRCFFISAFLFSVMNLLYYNFFFKSIFFRYFLRNIYINPFYSRHKSLHMHTEQTDFRIVNATVNRRTDHRASGMRSVVCFYMLRFPVKLVFMHITGLSLTFIDIYYTNMLKIYCTFKSKVI